MNNKEIANILVYDYCVEDEDSNTASYYFKTNNKEDAIALLNKFYKEDEIALVGCSICIDQNMQKKYVEATYLIPQVDSYGQVMELFPVSVKLEEKLIRLLMKKVNVPSVSES